MQSIGYTYNEATDKWNISDAAADYIFTGNQILDFALPGTLKVIVYPATWQQIGLHSIRTKYFPIFEDSGYIHAKETNDRISLLLAIL